MRLRTTTTTTSSGALREREREKTETKSICCAIQNGKRESRIVTGNDSDQQTTVPVSCPLLLLLLPLPACAAQCTVFPSLSLGKLSQAGPG